MPNHQQMRIMRCARWQLSLQQLVSALGRCAWWDEMEPQGDAVDVRVDRHRVAAEVEHQDARGGLWPDTLHLRQPMPGFRDRHIAEECQVIATRTPSDLT